MTGFEQAAAYLPADLKICVNKLSGNITNRVQEIRLRSEAPLVLSAPDGECMLTVNGKLTQWEEKNSIICSRRHLEECFLKLCEYSIHTHQQELRSGFITTPNGCRAGIAGTAVVENGKITSVRAITSICLRVSRRHDGCASKLVEMLCRNQRIQSTLLCGEPSSGKSSILKDLARQLSNGYAGRRFRVSVVDERGELSGDSSLNQCDILKYCPKAEGIQQAVRCLAPDVILFDELGTGTEVNAVLEGLNAGVTAISTAHCRDRETLVKRPQLLQAIQSGAFDTIVFLKGRNFPGEIAEIVKTGDLINEYSQNYRTGTSYPYGNRRGNLCVG